MEIQSRSAYGKDTILQSQTLYILLHRWYSLSLEPSNARAICETSGFLLARGCFQTSPGGSLNLFEYDSRCGGFVRELGGCENDSNVNRKMSLDVHKYENYCSHSCIQFCLFLSLLCSANGYGHDRVHGYYREDLAR